MNAHSAPPRRPPWRGIAGELVITLMASLLVWLLIGFGNPDFLRPRGLAYSIVVGVSVYTTVRVLEALLGARLARLSAVRQRVLRTGLYFAGGCLGYLLGMWLGGQLMGVRSSRSASDLGIAVSVLGAMAVALGLSFNAFAHLQSRLRASVIRLANAGLPDPYLLARQDAPAAVVAPGPRLPLGALAGVEHQTVQVRLQHGDRLVFLTDGLPEAPVAATDEPLGYAGFERALAAVATAAPARLLDDLVARVEKLVRLPRDDDWTVVALTRQAHSAG